MSKTPMIRVATIKFSPQGKRYLARCDRRDIGVGDKVEVLAHDGCYENAEVVGIQHERWHCTRINVVNLASEFEHRFCLDDDDFYLTRTVKSARPALHLVGTL